MMGILPLVTATALGLLAMQPRTVWRQGVGPKNGAKSRQAAQRSASDAGGPVGGAIDDPLPADYERSGRELPGPVLQPAPPVDGDEPLRDEPPEQDRPRDAIRPREPATAGLRDVIGTVKPAAATKPVEIAKPPGTRGTRRNEPSQRGPAAGAKEPDESKGPSLIPAKPAKLAEEPKEQERPQARTKVKSKSSVREMPATLAKNVKNEKKSKQAAAHGEPPSPSDRPPESSKASVVPSGALLGLFASLGTNLFLLWVAASQRGRYRALVRDTFENDLPAVHAGDADDRDHLPHWEAVDDDPQTAQATHANDN